MEIIIGAEKVYGLFIFCISLIFRNKTLLFLRECCFVLRSYDIYYSQITGFTGNCFKLLEVKVWGLISYAVFVTEDYSAAP